MGKITQFEKELAKQHNQKTQHSSIFLFRNMTFKKINMKWIVHEESKEREKSKEIVIEDIPNL